MTFGELSSGVANAGMNYLQSQIPGGAPTPVATTPAPTAGYASRSGAMMGGVSLAGIAVAYFVLRWLGLLPRWLRII